MSDIFKRFVTAHREEFDTGEPGKELLDKIDARMDLKSSSRISSKWLSKFKYLGFSASVVIIAVYMITANLNNPAFESNKKDQANHSAQDLKVDQNGSGLNTPGNNIPKETSGFTNNQDTSKEQAFTNSDHTTQYSRSNNGGLQIKKEDPLNINLFETQVSDQDQVGPEASVHVLPEEAGKPTTSPANEKINPAKSKKAKIYIPEEPGDVNTYTGTLYDASSFRPLLRAYKFPGKFSIDDDGHRTNLRTISCSRLEKIPNIKAVWLKGKTTKLIELSIKRRFKNIVLVKRDGRKLRPEAVSHYYRGLGAISEYKGRYFNLLFTDKVELILFFKDAEEGDKIIIDGTIEAPVKNQP